jgi:acyl-CoA synthetase (AMP-forming)/AMP-acid ligase II
VDQTQARDPILQALIDDFMAGGAGASTPTLHWRKTSGLSSRAVVDNLQMQAVAIQTTGLPTTLLEMLTAQPSTAPLLREARHQDPQWFTSYGQVLRFCQPGGEGDLRRLGVQPGEVVAYLAPPGGSVTAALAFLSIACQACAAPLDPRLSEVDTWMALEQIRPQHLVLFIGMAAPAAEAAFERYAQTGQAQLHRAEPTRRESPGLFQYCNPRPDFEHQPALVNGAEAICLLLRTSGTTGVAKLIPLGQRSVVWNGVILAEGLGLTCQDVTYSVMPLYHIGGISASVVASLAVGAAITGDGAYTPETMVEALSHSNPAPTWYSAVPSIHNATLRYLYHTPTLQFDQDGVWRGHQLRLIRIWGGGAAGVRSPTPGENLWVPSGGHLQHVGADAHLPTPSHW